MLWRLLKTYLAPYRRELTFVLGLQLVATIAALYLPTLNADIIDNGVVRGDTGYIIRVGLIMLVVSLVQVGATIAAVYFGSRSAMSLGRDLRAAIFRAVGAFSSREMAGLRSALTDHPEHQRRAAGPDGRRHGSDDDRDGADHDGGRDHHGPPGRCRALLARRGRRARPRRLHRFHRITSDPVVPQDAEANRRSSTGSSASRRRASACSAPSSVSPMRHSDSPRQRRADGCLAHGGPMDGGDVPIW